MTKNQSMKVVPSPEVKEPQVESNTRKKHTVEYKLRILREADQCKGQPGGVGALLRKEGLYSSLLALWRRQRDSGALAAFGAKRGRKAKFSPLEIQLERLGKENRRLQEQLRQANLIIEAQKKISEILGVSVSNDGESL